MDFFNQQFYRFLTPHPAPMNYLDLLNLEATPDMNSLLQELSKNLETLESALNSYSRNAIKRTQHQQEQPASKDPSVATPKPNSSYKVPASRTRQISPVGRRCLVKCTLDGVAVEALWDTGAQCTIINETWRAKHLPHTVLRPLKDLTKTGKMNLVTATGTPISIIGWLNIELKLYKGEKETDTLTVPTVVANDSCAAVRPIIGFNVIEKSKDANLW